MEVVVSQGLMRFLLPLRWNAASSVFPRLSGPSRSTRLSRVVSAREQVATVQSSLAIDRMLEGNNKIYTAKIEESAATSGKEVKQLDEKTNKAGSLGDG